MLRLDPGELGAHADRLRSRSGVAIEVRFATPADAAALQAYFRGLSQSARYNRLMGAASELPAAQLDRLIHSGQSDGFSLLATNLHDGGETIVGEARYAVDEAAGSVEIGLSVVDAMQGHGIGAALLGNLACRAAALGATQLFGDTLRTNDAMIALARSAGFALAPTPGDWKQVRFTKSLAPTAGMPCASARLLQAMQVLPA